MPRNEVEDGMGFAGLVPNREERKQERELELRRAYMQSLPFCPDHRDKVKGKSCRECEIERLKSVIRRIISGRWSVTELQESIGDI